MAEDKLEIVKSLLCVCCCCLDSKLKIKYLALDGTSWEYGGKKIHLLTLSVVYDGVSIPIWWEELDKKGHSNFEERKKVIEEASKFLNLRGLILLADREYAGKEWFKYLKTKKIGFIIRLKEKTYKKAIERSSIKNKSGKHLPNADYATLEKMALLRFYEKTGVSKRFTMNGNNYTFVVFKNPKKDAEEKIVYFISTLLDKEEIVNAYPIRWTIETCFKHLKSNGFNLEEMNFKKSEKIMMMMALVVFLYVLCITEGLEKLKIKKVSDWKKYKNGKCFLAVSVFRKGLSYLSQKFNNLVTFIDYLADKLLDKNLVFLQNVQ